jgi:hypothetical protein
VWMFSLKSALILHKAQASFKSRHCVVFTATTEITLLCLKFYKMNCIQIITVLTHDDSLMNIPYNGYSL